MNDINNKSRDDYLAGGYKPLETASSILVSSSKYLNSPRLRHIVAHEALRKDGWDIPVTAMLPEFMHAINELHDYQQDLKAIEEERQRLPEFAAFLDERFISDIRAEDLKNCAPGTLGAEVYAFMTGTGMDINFQRETEIFSDDLHYYTRRSGQCHDIEHIVTGLGPNPWGEMALIFFKATMDSHYFSPAVASIIHRQILTSTGTYFIKTNLHYPQLMPGLLDAFRLGVDMAKRVTRQFLYIKWEEYWDTPLDALRRELNIVGFPPKGAWDWTEEAHRG